MASAGELTGAVDVHSVSVGSLERVVVGVEDQRVPEGHILGELEMDCPCWRVRDCYVRDDYVSRPDDVPTDNVNSAERADVEQHDRKNLSCLTEGPVARLTCPGSGRL